MGLASSAGSGISPTLLAQLESLNNANRNPTQADQQKASEISALLKAHQSMLGYANVAGGGGPNLRGGYSAPADGTHSPHNLPQHPGVSDATAMALLQHAMQSRDGGNSQHGFGAPPDRQG